MESIYKYVAKYNRQYYDEIHCVTALFLVNHGCDDEEGKAKLLCAICRLGKLNMLKELVNQHSVDVNGKFNYAKISYCKAPNFFKHITLNELKALGVFDDGDTFAVIPCSLS